MNFAQARGYEENQQSENKTKLEKKQEIEGQCNFTGGNRRREGMRGDSDGRIHWATKHPGLPHLKQPTGEDAFG